jgi:hypothetical protein
MGSNAALAKAPSIKHSLNSVERVITIGSGFSIYSISPSQEFAVIFEDDTDSAYLYAVSAHQSDREILDLMNIYTVGHVSDIRATCTARVSWSEDAWKAILVIDGYPHAVFNFLEKRGYCRTNYPNVSSNEPSSWHSEDHGWQDAVLSWFR